jgi:hypothetical protein
MRKRYTSRGRVFFLKDESVRFQGTDKQYAILHAAALIYLPTPQRLVITSANDGKHMEGSKHYDDEALDLRVWHLINPQAVAEQIQNELGEDFDVILEWREEGGEEVPSHIHVEYDPVVL